MKTVLAAVKVVVPALNLGLSKPALPPVQLSVPELHFTSEVGGLPEVAVGNQFTSELTAQPLSAAFQAPSAAAQLAAQPAPGQAVPGEQAPQAAAQAAPADSVPPEAAHVQAQARFDGASPDLKPVDEWWTVDGVRYAGTSDLLARLPPSKKARRATYHLSHTRVPYAKSHARKNAVTGALGGGGAAVALAAFLFGLFGLFSLGFFFFTGVDAMPTAPAAAVVAGIFAIGAVIGGVSAKSQGRELAERGETIEGKLDGATFTTSGLVKDSSIDLLRWEKAPHYALPALEKRGLKDALAGAGLMAAGVLASTAGSIIGFGFAAYAASSYNEPAQVGGRVSDNLAGAVSIALHALGAIVAINTEAWWLLYASAGLAVLLGAFWGLAVLPRYRRGKAALKAVQDQWWAQKPVHPS